MLKARTSPVKFNPAARELRREFFDGGRHSGLFGLRQTVVEGQPHQTVAKVFRHRTIPRFAPETPAHGREMERQIMEDAQDATRLKMVDEGLPLRQGWQQQVVHVPGLFALARHKRTADGVSA